MSHKLDTTQCGHEQRSTDLSNLILEKQAYRRTTRIAKKRNLLIFFFLPLVLFARLAVAYQPNDWLHFSWPYSYDLATSSWYYYNESDIQWVACNGEWSHLDTSSLANGWSYWQWPWAYDDETSCWYYVHEPDIQWVYSYISGQWYQLGDTYYCESEWTACSIYCGFLSNPWDCRADCLREYEECLAN